MMTGASVGGPDYALPARVTPGRAETAHRKPQGAKVYFPADARAERKGPEE